MRRDPRGSGRHSSGLVLLLLGVGMLLGVVLPIACIVAIVLVRLL